MSNEVFIAFWVGVLSGLILGIMIAAIFTAISNSIERTEK